MGLFRIAVGLLFGIANEKSHLRSLAEREATCQQFALCDHDAFPDQDPQQLDTQHFTSEVAIASDGFKNFCGHWRNILGGNIDSYQTMVDRGQREARLRLIQQAQQAGFNAICNVRFNHCDIGGSAINARGGLIMVGMLASGTAYHRQSQ